MSSEVSKAILEQGKLVEKDYDYIYQSFKKQKLCTNSKNSKSYKFHIKIYLESIVSI